MVTKLLTLQKTELYQNKDGDGFGGKIMYNLESGDPTLNIRFKKSFADGGRIGLKAGMTKRAFLKLMGGFGS